MTLLYTGMKVFHFTEKIESLPLSSEITLPPIHVRIKPTNICNHNCSYCAYRVDSLQLGKDMNERDFIPKEKMLEIAEDMVDMGVKAVSFSGGGDPFCYPYLLETVEKLSSGGVNFASLTNGSRLSGEIADFFAANATWIRLSMDGWDDESYSRYRRVSQGEFTMVMKNMAEFKKLGGGCYLGVSFIVDRHNARHTYTMLSKLKDIGVDSVKVSPCIVSNSGRENNLYHSPVFEKVKSLVTKAKEELEDDSYEIYDSYHELDEKFEKDYHWCPFLQVLPVIGADLNIYPCQDKAYNLEEGLVGSIKECSFKEFWFGKREKFFRIDPSIHCKHHCVANSKNRLILEYFDADKRHLCFV